MIVCRKCSRRYANGTEFCACGAFLEFDGEYVEDRTVLAEDPKDGVRGNGPQPSIFLSDRSIAGKHAGRLYDMLVAEFGAGRVFAAAELASPSVDFDHAVDTALMNSDAVLVVIGPGWLQGSGSSADNRSHDDEVVHTEVSRTLTLKKLVIPILVQGIGMPRADELPDDLRSLSRRNPFTLSDDHFDHDVRRLVEQIRTRLRSNWGGLDLPDASLPSPQRSVSAPSSDRNPARIESPQAPLPNAPSRRQSVIKTSAMSRDGNIGPRRAGNRAPARGHETGRMDSNAGIRPPARRSRHKSPC